jgi:hypothetical protein
MHHLPPKLFSISGILQKCREPCFWKSTLHFCKVRKFEIILCIGGRHPHWGSSWIPSGSTHGLKTLSGTVFLVNSPVGTSETIPTNAPVGRSVQYWMVAVFHPPPDPALTNGYKSNRFDYCFLDFYFTFWILTTLTPSYLLTYVAYSPS